MKSRKKLTEKKNYEHTVFNQSTFLRKENDMRDIKMVLSTGILYNIIDQHNILIRNFFLISSLTIYDRLTSWLV